MQNFKGITIDDGIFVGGIPLSMPHFSERVTITKGFAGCIRRILINNETLFDADKNINLAKGKTGIHLHFRFCSIIIIFF